MVSLAKISDECFAPVILLLYTQTQIFIHTFFFFYI